MSLEDDSQIYQPLLVSQEERENLENDSIDLPQISLNSRQLCDLELLLNRAFYPLSGLLNRKDYNSVLETMRLQDGTLWPIPVVLDVSERIESSLNKHPKLALRDPHGTLLAILDVEDLWRVNYERESQCIFGTLDQEHPGVQYLFQETKLLYLGGRLHGIRLPQYSDFPGFRHHPNELRRKFRQMAWKKIVAFQTRNPMHRAHVELTKHAAEENNAKILIHPVVGVTKPGDIDHMCRVRCYEHVLKYYQQGSVMLALLPLAMRMAGPREALWHALIRKNYGCTHFIVGRDHAGPGVNAQGKAFYDPYAAQDMLRTHQAECGIQMVPFQEMVYVPDERQYLPVDQIPKTSQILRISGTRLREMMDNEEEIPDWYTFPEITEELKRYPSSKKA